MWIKNMDLFILGVPTRTKSAVLLNIVQKAIDPPPLLWTLCCNLVDGFLKKCANEILITDIVVWSCLCIHCILWYTLAQCLPCFLPTHKGPKCAPGRRWIQKGIHNCQKWGLTLLVPQNPHLNQGAPQDQLFSIQLAIKLFHKAFTWLGSPPWSQQKRWVCD